MINEIGKTGIITDSRITTGQTSTTAETDKDRKEDGNKTSGLKGDSGTATGRYDRKGKIKNFNREMEEART